MMGFVEGVIERFQEIFSPQFIGAQFAVFLTKLILALSVLLIFYILWRILQMALRAGLERSRLDRTSISFIETIAKYALLSLAVIKALDAAGVKTTAFLASLGILGLTIGFAAKDALSNLISGILIFVDRPFTINDLIEIEDNYGRVDKITLRSTRIITNDGKMLAVPNTEIINRTVASYTNFPHLRLDVVIAVAVDENLQRCRNILLSLVQNDPDYLGDPPPRIVVKQLDDYKIELEIEAWLDDERKHVEKRYELREKAYHALSAAGVVMPFETIQLTPVKVSIDGPERAVGEYGR